MKKQKILCVLLAIILVSGISISSFATDNIQNTITNLNTTNSMNELNNEKEETEENLKRVNSQLEYVQGEMSATLLEIQRIDDKVREYEAENAKYATRLQELETSVKQTQEKLVVLTEDYNKKRTQLKNRLVALYEAGDIAYLDVLLAAESLSDFLSIYYIMVEIAEYDSNLIAKVDEQRKEMDIAKRKLENERSEIRVLKARAEQTEIVLRNNKTLQEGYIKELSEKEQKINSKIQEYKNEMMAIEAKIQQANSYNGELDIQYTGGTMIWPVAIAGTGITSYYGTREHPIAGVIRFHQGLDIGNTGFGAPVVAVLDGVVTYAGELGSYGNCVMIYHGNGITTLYGHGQAVLTQRGAQVKQGDLIMQTGSTGNSTGPHLHFEVRVNGSTTNPLNYVNAP
ncbi:MAG: peptidoglycan DD-metalloendopeptidase family protein [Clostridia bacterium]|nr:peptidoglycan DD-metalloendopeptidase family protein [Clostridia bacterium]